jgi:hypothetical protein
MNTNPLYKHFRTPGLYISLPSAGRWWPEGALDLPANNEIAVLPLTTRDEILLRTPDALLNGEGVVRAIESCCPNIKDAWNMPSVDVDTLLISIRIASYGSAMPITQKCPHCGDENDFDVDLHNVLSRIQSPTYEEFTSHGLTIRLKPPAYFSSNESKKLAFEEQQMLRFIATDPSEGAERSKLFQERLDRMVDLTIKSLCDSTAYIETAEGTRVTNTDHISEFYNNADRELLSDIKSQLVQVKELVDIKPLDMTCTECKEHSTVTLEFDYSSFFGNGS